MGMSSMISARTARWMRALFRVGVRWLYAPLRTRGASGKDDDDLKVRSQAFSFRSLPSKISRIMFPNVPEHHPLHRKLQLAKSQSKWGRYWDFLMILISLYACAAYVAEQYDADYDAVQVYGISELVVTQFFAVDFLYSLASAPVWITFLIAPWTIVDMLTIVPVYATLGLSAQGTNRKVVNLSVLRFIRILRLVRILRMFKLLNGLSGVRRQMITLTLTLMSLLFMAAGIMQFMENDAKQLLDFDCQFISDTTNWLPSCDRMIPAADMASCDCDLNNCQPYYSYYDEFGQPGSVRCQRLTFLSAFYYILVTAATIGYGDIAPSTEVSRAVVIFIIFTTMTVIPVQVNTLTTLLSMTSQYRQPYVKASDEHVIICGYVQDWRKLEDFLKELLHPDRSNSGGSGSGVDEMHVVILSPLEPSEDLKSLLLKSHFDGRITYLVGSALNMSDLQRVRADSAVAVFFLCNPEIHENASKLEDAATVLRTLSVSNFNSKTACFVQLLKSEDRDILKGVSLDFVVCLDEMKCIVQARNCVCPGFSTLIENLFHTFGMSLKEQVGNRCYLTDKPLWQQSYIKGASKELYSVPVSLAYVESCSFEWSLVAEGIYLMFDCIVIGAYNSQTGDVLINPCRADLKKYRYMSKFFENYDAVIVLADERSQVSRVEGDLSDRTAIQRCLKKICIAEDYFAVRRALPTKFREGSKFVRNKVTIREITRIVKGYGKMSSGVVGPEGDKAKQQAKMSTEGGQSPSDEGDGGFIGFLTDKSNVWNKFKSGALKTANMSGVMNMLGGGHGTGKHTKHRTVAEEIDQRRREGTWIEEEENEEEGEDFESESKADPNGRPRSKSEEHFRAGSPTEGQLLSRMSIGLKAARDSSSSNVFDSSIISDASSIRNHIVVFGYTKNVIHFINELRRPVLAAKEVHPIVVVSPELPPSWDHIAEHYPNVFFVTGTLSSNTTFNKTNIKHAYAIILLSGRDNVTKVEEEYLDADTLFTYMKLEKYIPRNVFFGVELTCASNMAVLNSSVIRQVSEYNKLQAVQLQAQQGTTAATEGAVHEFKARINFAGRDVSSFKGSFTTFKILAPLATVEGGTTTIKQSTETAQLGKEQAEIDSLVALKPTSTLGERTAPEMNAVSLPPLTDDTFWTIDESINILPVFASGNAYVPVSFDSLMVQSFFDTFIPRLCEGIVCGTSLQTMRQVPVPRAMAGCFFVDMYRSLLSRYVLLVALYRGPDAMDGNVLPYVHTAPPPETILRENDKMFVFGSAKEVDDCIHSLDYIQLNDREVTLREPLASLLTGGKPSPAPSSPSHASGGAAANAAANAANAAAAASKLSAAMTSLKPVASPDGSSAGRPRRNSALVVIPANIADGKFEV